MNTDILEGKWKQLVGRAKALWADMTEDDLKRAEGGVDKLVGVIQEKYGKTKDEAQKHVQDFLDSHKDA